MAGNLGRFTQGARQVLQLANDTAERLSHNYIGTEHLLLGLVREESGIAGKVLRDLGAKSDRVAESVERMTGAGRRSSMAKLELTPRTKQVLEFSIEEAKKLNHEYIGTEHLLLGLLRQGDGIAIDVLKQLGLTSDRLWRETLQAIQAVVTEASAADREPTASLLIDLAPFTPAAQRALMRANSTAERFRHISIGQEHILISLIHEPAETAGRVLRDLGVPPDELVLLVVQLIGAGAQKPASNLYLSPSARTTIQNSLAEAKRLDQTHADTGHLLLGLLRQPSKLIVDVLSALHLTAQQVSEVVDAALQADKPK